MPGGRAKKAKNSVTHEEESDSEEDKNCASNDGSKKVVSLLETISLGMDQLLKQNVEKHSKRNKTDPNAKSDDINTPIIPAPDPDQAIAKLIPSWAMGSTITATGKYTAKSGESRTAADNVLCHIKWPQEYIYAVDGSQLKFSNMSAVQFIRGFIAMINASSVGLRPYMLTHLSETMLDAEKFAWDSVLKFQAEVFHGIESGKITFKDLDVINLWRLRHNFQPSNAKSDCQGN